MLITVTIHEFSHAFVATLQGDETPVREGRLTFDPRAHIDVTGLLMLVIIGFGWGRPVPFNPHNLKFKRFGPTLVALAGPAANFLGLLFFGAMNLLLIRTGLFSADNLLIDFLFLLMTLNLVLMLFNLIPIPPLDGSRVLLDALHHPRYDRIRWFLEHQGPFLLLALIVFDTFLPFSIFGSLFASALSVMHRIFFLFI